VKKKIVGWGIFILVAVPFAVIYSAYVEKCGEQDGITVWINRAIIIMQNSLLYYLLRWERRQLVARFDSENMAEKVDGWIVRQLRRWLVVSRMIDRVRQIIPKIKTWIVRLATRINHLLEKCHMKNIIVGNLFVGVIGSLYLRGAVSIVGLKKEPVKFFPAIIIAIYLKGYTELYFGKALAMIINWF
jgi:hypothetical protein